VGLHFSLKELRPIGKSGTLPILADALPRFRLLSVSCHNGGATNSLIAMKYRIHLLVWNIYAS